MMNRTENGTLQEIPLIKPQLDFMLIQKIDRGSNIHIIGNEKTNADIYKVLAIGPGYYLDGKLIKPTIEVGDRVVIVGNIFDFKYKDKTVTLARTREVIAVVM